MANRNEASPETVVLGREPNGRTEVHEFPYDGVNKVIYDRTARRVRRTYDGPLSLALDYMVWNVTKDDIRVRMSSVDEEVWPSPALKKKNPPDGSKMIPFSDFTKSGALALPEVVGPIFDEVNEKYGTKVEPIWK